MASPFGPPPVSLNTLTAPSAATRQQRPLRISVSTTEPSSQTTGPSGKPKSVARIVTSLMIKSLHFRYVDCPARACSWTQNLFIERGLQLNVLNRHGATGLAIRTRVIHSLTTASLTTDHQSPATGLKSTRRGTLERDSQRRLYLLCSGSRTLACAFSKIQRRKFNRANSNSANSNGQAR